VPVWFSVNGAAIAIGIIGAVFAIAFVWAIVWALGGNPLGGTPRWIARHIRDPGSVYVIRMRVVTQAWNPQKLGGFANSISGRGLAMYWLDESGLVHLWFAPNMDLKNTMQDRCPKLFSTDRRHRGEFVSSSAWLLVGMWC